MSIHRIPLRGPWKVSPLDLPDLKPVQQPLPEDWCELVAISGNGVRLQRTFHRPTGLDGQPPVWIAITNLRGGGDVRLNGQHLTSFQAAEPTDLRVEIGSRLEPTNHLKIELQALPENPQSTQYPQTEVALEIEG